MAARESTASTRQYETSLNGTNGEPLKPLPPAHVFSTEPTAHANAILPSSSKYTPHEDIPNTPFMVSFISFVIGGIFWIALSVTLPTLFTTFGRDEPSSAGASGWGTWARPQLGVYVAALAFFHLMEFWVTAVWNTERVSVDAFLLNNGKSYPTAHLVGALEYFMWSYLWPRNDWWWMQKGWLYIAFPLLVGAQALRTLAMIHASASFSHAVSRGKKADDHVLVTWGVYRFSRHPSYTGFFYWAVATQFMLGNPISIVGFTIVLAKFFEARIIDEEIHLVRFFGQDYVRFRQRVGTWLPAGLVSKAAR